ncbi:DUF6498-containing protein [Hellea sp.]|nr:DUF6498-containing protein [Hellea sp.]
MSELQVSEPLKTGAGAMSFWARLGLIISNLVPLMGVIYWGWDTTTLFVLYYVELIVVIILSVPKSIIARHGTKDKQPSVSALIALPLIFFVFPTAGTYMYLVFFFDAQPVIASLFVKGPVQYSAFGIIAAHLFYAIIDVIKKSRWETQAPMSEFTFALKYLFTVVFPIWSLGQLMGTHIKDPMVVLIAYVAFKIWMEAILYRYDDKFVRH